MRNVQRYERSFVRHNFNTHRSIAGRRAESADNFALMALSGIINVYKPGGMTSRDVVDRVKWITRPEKVGHAGTLDPLATGVLVICVGQVTRLIQYVQRLRKSYSAKFLLGCRSDTDDLEGEVVTVPGAPIPTRAQLDEVLARFVGDIQQRPPAHSAIKIAGRRAYKLARRGEIVDLAARTVTIHSLDVRRYEYPELEVDIECGSGTYVRALARDIGEALGTAALMLALHRSAIGCFRAEDACRLEDLTSETLEKHIQPAIRAVSDLAQIALTEVEQEEVRHGRPIRRFPTTTVGANNPLVELAAVDSAGQLAAILYEKHPDELWPKINLW